MREKSIYFLTLCCLTILICGCVSERASLKIEKSLPPNRLAYFNDSFDKLREDLWDNKALLIPSEAAMANFKLADVRIKDGKLTVDTKTGCFSMGGLATKFSIRGNFDIQVNCHIDFLDGDYGLDQVVYLIVCGRSKMIENMDAVVFGVLKREGSKTSVLFTSYVDDGKHHPANWKKIGNFHGTLRVVRIDDKVTVLYRKVGQEGWKKLNTLQSTTDDVAFAFRLKNFTLKRNSITAKSSITAKFDNFRINAAEGIIEEEI